MCTSVNQRVDYDVLNRMHCSVKMFVDRCLVSQVLRSGVGIGHTIATHIEI
jgi:hypothetical protein